MQRLVYAPRVDVWVKSSALGDQIIDLSPYVTNCTVQRKVDQVSSATVGIRNPNMKWTESKWADGGTGPAFHPMDPIVISLTRIKDRPIQVFTGYCDTTPYLQLFPGPTEITASCTLKRLQYTYWDAGLPFVQSFLNKHGWNANVKTGQINSKDAEQAELSKSAQLTDGSIGGLLFNVLEEIGNWPENTIYIENLPEKLIERVSMLFTEVNAAADEAQENFDKLLKDIIGTASLGTGKPGGGGSSSVNLKGLTARKLIQASHFARESNGVQRVACAVMIAEAPKDGKCLQAKKSGGTGGAMKGIWQFNPNTWDSQDAFDPLKATNHAYGLYKDRGWQPWQAYTDGSYRAWLGKDYKICA